MGNTSLTPPNYSQSCLSPLPYGPWVLFDAQLFCTWLWSFSWTLIWISFFFLTHTQLFGSSNTWKSFFSMRCVVRLDIWTQRLLLSKLFMKSGIYPKMTCTGWHNYFPSTYIFLCFSKVKIWAHAHLLLLSSFQSIQWKYRFMIFLVRL